MRDYIGELAAISEDANKEIMLASAGTGEQALATCPISSESDPIVPGQFRPRRAAFIPMQDDRIVGRPFHSGLLAWCDASNSAPSWRRDLPSPASLRRTKHDRSHSPAD